MCALLLELFSGGPFDPTQGSDIEPTGGIPNGTRCTLLKTSDGANSAIGSARGTTSVGWEGPTEEDPQTRAITAPGFNELIASQRPTWARSAFLAAWMLLDLNSAKLDCSSDEFCLIAITESAEQDGRTSITITISNLPDDSTEAGQDELVFERAEDGLFRFVSGTATQRCQPNRGHQDFTTGPCS